MPETQVASRVRRGRVGRLVLGLVVGLVLAMSPPALARGAHDKATGSGSWINGGGLDFYAEFSAHAKEGNREAKGSLYQSLNEGFGGFTVSVDTVIVDDDRACFGGITDSAWGMYESREGQYRWTTVVDGGAGEDERGADYLRGGWANPSSPPAWCIFGITANNEEWYGGNVQIHFAD